MTNRQMKSIDEIYQKVRNDFEWIIAVDIDEFVTAKVNPHNTIRDELQTTFKDVDCIKVPWINMACNGLRKSPKRVLESIIYRWDYDKKHNIPIHIARNFTKGKKTPDKFKDRYDKIETKSIFRTRAFKKITTSHFPSPDPLVKSEVVDSLDLKKVTCEYPFIKDLREVKIAKAHLLCYHYRIISEENCIKKIKNNVFYTHYRLELLMSYDFPEIIDESLRIKSLKNRGELNQIKKHTSRYPSFIEKLIILLRKQYSVGYARRFDLMRKRKK